MAWQSVSAFSQGVNQITVASTTNIRIGNAIKCQGILDGTRVTNIVGASITLSHPTYAAGSGGQIVFKGTGVPNGSRVISVDAANNKFTISQAVRRITACDSRESSKSICKEIALQRPKTGKFDYFNTPNRPAHSMAFEFFTDD